MRTNNTWTNPSVLELAAERDPIAAIVGAARDVVLNAMDSGWQGPPFDPLALAEIRGIRVRARAEVRDARIVEERDGRFLIEFNPNRSRGRVRYSVAHEIAHTLFEDCGDFVRHRGGDPTARADNWQLEALCNIAAAEFVMPIGSLSDRISVELNIDELRLARDEFDVSWEALLIRAVRLSPGPYTMFCASQKSGGRYSLDYTIEGSGWLGSSVKRGTVLPKDTIVSSCMAIGLLGRQVEKWGRLSVSVQCVAIPPYPGDTVPRVVGIVSSEVPLPTEERGVRYLQGNVLHPQGEGRAIVAHVVNDRTPNWGGNGVAAEIRRKWPEVQADFREWARESSENLRLGSVHFMEVDNGITVASLVAQKGYGPSPSPRIRYDALLRALQHVAERAEKWRNTTVHLPRIGCGQAGGRWELINELLRVGLVAEHIPVVVYDLPGQRPTAPPRQGTFAF